MSLKTQSFAIRLVTLILLSPDTNVTVVWEGLTTGEVDVVVASVVEVAVCAGLGVEVEAEVVVRAERAEVVEWVREVGRGDNIVDK